MAHLYKIKTLFLGKDLDEEASLGLVVADNEDEVFDHIDKKYRHVDTSKVFIALVYHILIHDIHTFTFVDSSIAFWNQFVREAEYLKMILNEDRLI